MYCYQCMNKLRGTQAVCPFCGKAPNGSAPVHHLKPGTLLADRYVIGSMIGEGGFGITYIGRDTKLDMRVAVKEFFLSGVAMRMPDGSVSVISAGDNEQRFRHGKEKFLYEARSMAMFSDTDGVVVVRDFFEANNTAYIVMEYLEGKTLYQTVKQNGRLPLDQTVELLTPVMQALTKIHSQGLIHRDIGPDNIMLTGDKVKLLDFGSARDIDRGSNTVMVKPGFAPEEQYRAEGEQSAALDVYSLTATIYFCITGVIPPAGITRLSRDNLQAPSQLGAVISPASESVILKGMSVRAQDRYQSIAELQEALQTAPAMSTVPAAPDEQNSFKTVLADDMAASPAPPVQPSVQPPVQPPVQPVRKEIPSFDQKKAPVNVDAPKQKKQKKQKTEPNVQNNTGDSVNLFDPPVQQAPVKKKGSVLKKILIAVAVLLVVVTVGLILIVSIGPKLQMTTVNGEDVKKGSKSYTFKEAQVTAEMMSEVDRKVKDLETLNFYACILEPEAYVKLVSMEQVTTLTFTGCPLADLSFLSQMPKVQHLTLKACQISDEMLAGIDFTKLTELKGCYLTGNTELKDLSPLKGAEKTITKVEADGTAVEDLSTLGKMDMITELSFNKCKISDLSPLNQNFTNLKHLSLAYNTISDLSGLENLERLAYLTLSYNQISDLTPLSTDKELYSVYLNNNTITDISPLKGAKLRLLNLEENQVEKVAPLAESTDLDTLFLKNNKVDDLSGLETCIHLKRLSVAGNQITDISPLQYTTLIKSLSLNDNQITDISPLKNTAGTLEQLYFDHNNVEDISVLSGASALEYVSFDGNKVSDISALAKKPELNGISAEQNAIVSIDALADSPKLNYIYLAFNQIEDITPLSVTRVKESSSYSSSSQVRMVINLSNNKIKKLSFADNANYSYLAIHGNPIEEIVNFPEEATYLSITYYDELDPDKLASSEFNMFQLVDCPLEKQVSFEESLNKGITNRVSFVTEEEANAAIAAQKHKMLYGESADDQPATEATETADAAQPTE